MKHKSANICYTLKFDDESKRKLRDAGENAT
jgi:hypothetical protein